MDPGDLVAVGADLAPSTLITAYASGVFPMAVRKRQLGWWCPDPRGVLPLDGLRVSRSLRRSIGRYQVTVDRDFEAVIRSCMATPRPHGWITDDFVRAYLRLFELGFAHSVEARDETGRLVGGLYGISIGGLFAGESMFSASLDASKVALIQLVERLHSHGATLLDVQWTTPHLATLGVIDVPRTQYLERLSEALDRPAGFG